MDVAMKDFSSEVIMCYSVDVPSVSLVGKRDLMSRKGRMTRGQIGLAAFAEFSDDREANKESVLDTDRHLPRGVLAPDVQYRRDLSTSANKKAQNHPAPA